MVIETSNASSAEPRRESLLKLLLADTQAARGSASSLINEGDWTAVFHEAEVWSVVSQLAERITGLGLEPPAEPWKDFKRLAIATYARTASRAAKGVKALAHLEQGGIRAVAFKGLASMVRLYPKPAERSIKDVDLLIMEQDLTRAVAALAEAGFFPVDGQGLDQLQALVQYLPNFSGNKAIVLQDSSGLEIDLHWSVGLRGLPASELIERAETFSLYGGSVHVVAAADALALTARHSVRENLAVDTMCRDLFDVRQTCALLAASGALPDALESACRSGGVLPLLALTRVLRALDETAVQVYAAFDLLTNIASKSERKAAEALQELFLHQVRHGRMEKDLVYLAHPRPVRQIVAGAWRNWREYRNLMQSMEEKLDGKTVSLGQRFWKLAVAAANAGPSRFSALRTLARLRFGSTGGEASR